jgi:hypothetical protein
MQWITSKCGLVIKSPNREFKSERIRHEKWTAPITAANQRLAPYTELIMINYGAVHISSNYEVDHTMKGVSLSTFVGNGQSRGKFTKIN